MSIDVSNTPEMYKIYTSGRFTFNTKCRVRNTPDMSDPGMVTYQVGQSVNYDSKLKNGNHFWLSYISNSGSRHYIPYANTDKGTYFGSDTNPGNPIKPVTVVTSGNTDGNTNTSAPHPGHLLGTLTGQAGANIADQTPDGTILVMSGSFTFDEPARGRDRTNMTTANKVDRFLASQTVYYNAKIKADGHYWFRYIHTSGATYYVPYATIDPYRPYGIDSNPGDPVFTQSNTGSPTGGSTNSNTNGGSHTSNPNATRPQGGQDTGSPIFQSRDTNFDIADNYESLHGEVKLVDNGAWSRSQPYMSATKLTHYAKGSTVNYTGKLHSDSRVWCIVNGQYLPIGKLSTPIHEVIGSAAGLKAHHSKFSYTEDYNEHQPWANIWPYSDEDANSDDRRNILVWENPRQELQPTSYESQELDRVHNVVQSVTRPDSVTIGFITDTHFSSYNTPSTARVLRQMKTFSYYAKHYGLDLMVHGGDLNDGVTEKQYEIEDVKRGMDALRLGQRPLLVAQGNHDDNSAFARDKDGYYPRNIITNAEAYPFRLGSFANLLDTRGNTANRATYGKYKIPNSKVNVIILDGFDQSDYYSTPIKLRRQFRHGWTHFSTTQQNWLRNTLNAIPDDELVLVVTHIMFKGLQFSKINEFAEASLDGSAAPGTLESSNIRQILVNYNNRTNNLIAVMGGHTHHEDYTYQYGIHWIVSDCALNDRGDKTFERGLNTTNEQAWDTLVINSSERKLHRIRYGWTSKDHKQTYNF